jgi:hypothetical protein
LQLLLSWQWQQNLEEIFNIIITNGDYDYDYSIIIYSNVCSTDYIILCLTETWLNVLCYDHNLFPDGYTVFCSDRVSNTKTRGGGVLTVLSSKIRTCKRRHDLEFYDECVWVEIPTLDNFNLLIVNHYFPPDTKPEIITNYFAL